MFRHHARIASLCLFGLCGLNGLVVRAQAPASPPARIAVKAHQVLDVVSGTYLSDAVVLIEAGKITAVGKGLPIEPGVRVIDLGAVRLLPGLIDAHTHLMADVGPDGYAAMLLTQSEAYRALVGAANARRTLLAGFTTVRDVENEGSGSADVALRDAIAHGLVEGPRMLVANKGIAAVGQYHPFGVSPDLVGFPHGAQMVSGVEEARRAVREQIGNGADLIKVYADWAYPTLTVDELKVVVEEAHKAGRRVAAHAVTVPAIQNALDAGVDSIEHGFRADRATLLRMKEKGVWLVPTLGPLVSPATADDEVRKRAVQMQSVAQKMVQTAQEVGVKIACGYDASDEGAHGTNAQELIALHAAGLSNLEALRAATLTAADLLGLSEKVGSLAPGKFADLIAVSDDPLADLHALERVVFVMKAGVVVKDETAIRPPG